MLSAMGTASYKSSLEPADLPRDEEEIKKELWEVENEIQRWLKKCQWYCDLDCQMIDLAGLMEYLNSMQKVLPYYYDMLDNLEEELCQARYEPEPPEDL